MNQFAHEPDSEDLTAEEQQHALKAWEKAYQRERTWEDLIEDAEGNLQARDQSALRDQQPIRKYLANLRRERIIESCSKAKVAKGMIRYVYCVLDCSEALNVEDMRPNRQAVMLPLMVRFIREFFDQNPLSQLGMIVCRDGKAERVTELSGSPEAHVRELKKAFERIGGSFSLQNGLESAMEGLRDVPPFGAREVILVISSLSTCDPGNIGESLRRMKKSKARANVICVAAETRVFKKLAEDTNGRFGVSLDQSHLTRMLLDFAPPPALLQETAKPALVEMGFPRREPRKFNSGDEDDDTDVLTIGPKRGEYRCPRCEARAEELPSQCGTCHLSLVSSPHLARSYHHLFPVQPFVEVKLEEKDSMNKEEEAIRECFGCRIMVDVKTGMLSKCLKCEKVFCFACDVFIHEKLHNCAGCLCTNN